MSLAFDVQSLPIDFGDGVIRSFVKLCKNGIFHHYESGPQQRVYLERLGVQSARKKKKKNTRWLIETTSEQRRRFHRMFYEKPDGLFLGGTRIQFF